MAEEARITKVNIEEQMKTAYIDYSMSVIVSRALPDVRDGLKPVHRRVLYGMSDLGLNANQTYKKSARIVGEVLGKYHPHGDTSVYDAMVRMAQTWSMRYPLVNGQGNFGSLDGDSPAAMRYTEAKLQKIAEEILKDIDKNTVDFQFNFDDTLEEPTVLPTRIPSLLINGASGIAVGMATNMAPHNLSEVVDATNAYIQNNDITIEELMQYVKAPDFPTGGTIYGTKGVKEAFETGRGRVVVRAKTEIELTPTGREKIVVTEIPYMVNKADLIKKTAELIEAKKIEGVSYINDESDRNGLRIVIILKKEAIANVVLNKLFKYTQFQNSFSVNNIALVRGRPRQLNLKQLIKYFVEHRHDVIVRRTEYDLEQAKAKSHILEGLLIALDHLDEIIKLIRSSKNRDEAKEGLMTNYELSEKQANAILDLRLHRLTALERNKIKEEHEELRKRIEYYEKLLREEPLRMQVIQEELTEVKEQFGDERRTDIIESAEDFNPEDFYADDNMIITISRMGYIKRTPSADFRTQRRGGVGSKGSTMRDMDFIQHIFTATMHNTMLFFTKKGRCFWLKVYEIPEGSKATKGRAIQNVINLEPEDEVQAFINVKSLDDPDYIKDKFIVLCTRKGIIKKTPLEAFSRPRQNGIIAIGIKEGDSLIEAKYTNGKNDILIAIRSGRAIRFNESKVRSMGRIASGVRGIRLENEEDRVVGMVCVQDAGHDVLVVSEKGYGKRSRLDDYRITNRGGKGVKTINITEKTGKLIAVKAVSDEMDLMIISKSGITIRLEVDTLRTMGRYTQGVRLMNLKEGNGITSVTEVEKEENDDDNGHVGDDAVDENHAEESNENMDSNNDGTSEDNNGNATEEDND